MQMQMNVDNPPVQELAVQPANLPTSTLFLDFGGVTDEGEQYVKSILKCENLEQLVKWAEDKTNAQDAADQALRAVEARSAGEYISKTAGSIGTVNYQLQRHEHEIGVNEYMGIENQAAICQIREDIKTERGNLRAYQKFTSGLDKDVKALQKDVKVLQKAAEKPQETKEALQQQDEKLQQPHQKVQEQYEKLQEEHEKLKEGA